MSDDDIDYVRRNLMEGGHYDRLVMFENWRSGWEPEWNEFDIEVHVNAILAERNHLEIPAWAMESRCELIGIDYDLAKRSADKWVSRGYERWMAEDMAICAFVSVKGQAIERKERKL